MFCTFVKEASVIDSQTANHRGPSPRAGHVGCGLLWVGNVGCGLAGSQARAIWRSTLTLKVSAQ